MVRCFIICVDVERYAEMTMFLQVELDEKLLRNRACRLKKIWGEYLRKLENMCNAGNSHIVEQTQKWYYRTIKMQEVSA